MTDLNKEELPQCFSVKYLGHKEARGLWGIRHTRRPVEALVEEAKGAECTATPRQLTVTTRGCSLTDPPAHFPIASISYGVQDLVYTRVFAMIVVGPTTEAVPFRCHGFVCESRHAARKLTYCLAAAFQEYGDRVRQRPLVESYVLPKYAVDLRTTEELAADCKTQDSEA